MNISVFLTVCRTSASDCINNTYASCPNAGGCMQLVYGEEAQKNRHLFIDKNKS